MKRLFIGLAALAAVFGGVWWSIHWQTARTEALLKDIEAIETAYYAGEYDRCLALCEQFPDTMRQRTRFFPTTMTHEELHTLEETAACLPVLYASKDEGAFLEALVRCKQKLKQLIDMEKPLIGNVL